jgi:hypothetical protein
MVSFQTPYTEQTFIKDVEVSQPELFNSLFRQKRLIMGTMYRYRRFLLYRLQKLELPVLAQTGQESAFLNKNYAGDKKTPHI